MPIRGSSGLYAEAATAARLTGTRRGRNPSRATAGPGSIMDERQQLLAAIEDFCEREGMAPTTFGRKALGDGRFTGRLRDGRQVRAATLARVRQFLADHDPAASAKDGTSAGASASRPAKPAGDDERGAFRFYDNRQKYLMFVNTCSEKWAVAERAGLELGHVHPRPPALRVFDAGMGDRHGAHRGHAADAPALPDDAVLHRGQGDLGRGRAPLPREDAGPALRASGDGAGDHQHATTRRRPLCSPARCRRRRR